MEKISGIIPSSPRVKSVDMRDAQPVRPGVPSFGRPMGISHVTANLRRSSIAQGLERPLTDREREMHEKAQIVESVSNGFFMREPSLPAIDLSEATGLEPMNTQASLRPIASNGAEALEGYQSQKGEELFPAQENYQEMEPEFTRPGSYVDVTA